MKKIFIVFVVLFSVIVLYGQKKQLSFDDFFKNYSFRQKSVHGFNSMNDGNTYSVLEKNSIVKYSYSSGKLIDTIYSIDKDKLNHIASYSFSNDEKKILITTNMESIYRRSFTADYFVVDLIKKTTLPLSENGKQQLATFSPDGTKVAFVRDNNLFVVDITNNVETQITSDGKFNYIINGAPDWVYEEEFQFNKAFDWSPDSKKIAFMRFDESNVKLFNMTMFKGSKPSYEENALYPSNYTFKYPKAGEDNSVITIKIYDIATKNFITADIGNEVDIYIPRLNWTLKNNIISVFRLNRLQNHLEILFINADNGSSNVVYSESNKYYIDEKVYDNISFIDEDNIIIMSECSGFMHLYKYNVKSKVLQQITAGDWDVDAFIDYDKLTKTVYYTSFEGSPIRTNLYSIRIDGKKRTRITKGNGTNNPIFAKGCKYFINYFSNATTPNYVTLNETSGKIVRVLEDNKGYREKISEYDYNTREFFTFTTSHGDLLNGYIIKPVNFNERKQYPVFMTQYSGPGSRSVTDSWSFGWETYLSSQGYLVVCVDPRGTGGRGEEFKKCTYLQMGKFESDDQIETAKYLKTLSFVDEDNIAIWGWSFGGFMSALCLEKGDGIFKAGISVAPVTNWRYYDNIYTERYLRTPQENPTGYDNNSPITHAANLKGHLLLIHGTADDNVHVQNSVEFSEMLVQANIQFDYMLYTNRDHGIYGGNTTYHLYSKVTDFLNKYLK